MKRGGAVRLKIKAAETIPRQNEKQRFVFEGEDTIF